MKLSGTVWLNFLRRSHARKVYTRKFLFYYVDCLLHRKWIHVIVDWVFACNNNIFNTKKFKKIKIALVHDCPIIIISVDYMHFSKIARLITIPCDSFVQLFHAISDWRHVVFNVKSWLEIVRVFVKLGWRAFNLTKITILGLWYVIPNPAIRILLVYLIK